MGARDRIPTLERGALRSTAAALVAFCWLAAPAGAAVLPAGEHVPPIDLAPAPDQVAAAGAAAPELTSSAAEAPPPTGPVDGGRPAVDAAVRGAAETVSGVANRTAPAVRKVTESPGVATGLTGPPPGDSAAPAAERAGGLEPRRAAHPVDRAGHGVAARAARLQGRGAESARRSESGPPEALEAAPPVEPTPRPDLAGGPPGALSGPVAGAAQATIDRPASPDPLPAAGGGSSAAAAAAGFSLGGLALLLATLLLARPALRRRMPSRTVTAWPSAFVPLLERPG